MGIVMILIAGIYDGRIGKNYVKKIKKYYIKQQKL